MEIKKLCILIGIGCFIGLCITYNSAIVQVSLKKWYYQLSDNADSGLDTQDGNITSAKIRHKTANNNNRPILSVLRQGRLGNGMWQYSGLLGLANMTNRVPILNSGYRDIAQIFTLSTQIDSRINILKASTRYEQRQLFINVEETVENIRNISEDVTLKGYFQYFRFFSSVTETIRKEFQFRTIIKQQVSTFFKNVNLTDEQLIKVGIHIRRTDLNTPRQIKQGFGPPPTNYFINAMNFFRSKFRNVHFVVCSDDIKWAREHIVGDDITFATNDLAALDMAILVSCDHVIISNGTFSWWVGWLCTGITVKYKRMPKYNSYLYNMTRGEYWPPNDTYNHYISIDTI